MRRGTTPTHTFELPFSIDLIKEIEITYQQSGKIFLQKRKTDCNCNGNSASLTLTQEETFLFKNDLPVEIQIRVLDKDEKAFASPVYRIPCEECLSDDVLT